MDRYNPFLTGLSQPSFTSNDFPNLRRITEESPSPYDAPRAAATLEDFIVQKPNNRFRTAASRMAQPESRPESRLETASQMSSVDDVAPSVISRSSAGHQSSLGGPVRPALPTTMNITGFFPRPAAPSRRPSTLETGSSHSEFRQHEHSNGDLTISRFSLKDEAWQIVGRIDASDVSYFIRFCDRSRTDNQHDQQKLQLYQEHILTMVKHLAEKRLKNLESQIKKEKNTVLQRSTSTSTVASSSHLQQRQFSDSVLGAAQPSTRMEEYMNQAYGGSGGIATSTPLQLARSTYAQTGRQAVYPSLNIQPVFPKMTVLNSTGEADPSYLAQQRCGREDESINNTRTSAGVSEAISMHYLRRAAVQNELSSAEHARSSVLFGQQSSIASTPLSPFSSNFTPVAEKSGYILGGGASRNNAYGVSASPDSDPFLDTAAATPRGPAMRSTSFTKPPSQVADFIPREQALTAEISRLPRNALPDYYAPADLKELRGNTEPVPMPDHRTFKRSNTSGISNPEAKHMTDEELINSFDMRSQLNMPTFVSEEFGKLNPKLAEDYYPNPDLDEWWFDGIENYKRLQKDLCCDLIKATPESEKEEANIGIPLMAALVSALKSYDTNRKAEKKDPFMRYKTPDLALITADAPPVVQTKPGLPKDPRNDGRVAFPDTRAKEQKIKEVAALKGMPLELSKSLQTGVGSKTTLNAAQEELRKKLSLLSGRSASGAAGKVGM